MKFLCALVVAFLLFTSAIVSREWSRSPDASSGYRLVKQVAIPGGLSWDYVTVDDSARRVYVTHGTQVDVLNADTFEIVGTIPNTPGVHGVAIAREFDRGFITAGKSDSVVIFDLKTLKPLTEVKVGKKPDAIVYDPATKHVYAMNGDGDSTTIIDAADGKVIGTVDLGGGPEFAVADGKGNIYVNLEEKAEITTIDSKAQKVVSHWSLAPGKTATALAFDPETRKLFAGCRGGQLMIVVDANSGKIVTTAPIGERVDAAAFDPATKTVFMSTGGGTVAIYRQDNDKYTLAENLPTRAGSKTMGLDPRTHNLFVPANVDGHFAVLVYAP